VANAVAVRGLKHSGRCRLTPCPWPRDENSSLISPSRSPLSMPPLTPNTFDQELDLLFAAADDFHDTESPRSNPPGGKRSSPDNDEDDDEGHNSGPEDENTNPNNENEAALE